MPTVDGKPGEDLQVDTGWMTLLEPDASGRQRRFRAWVFTPSVSRYRFVYPCFSESTETAGEACEAAWEFYGGVFGVLLPGFGGERLIGIQQARTRALHWCRHEYGMRRHAST